MPLPQDPTGTTDIFPDIKPQEKHCLVQDSKQEIKIRCVFCSVVYVIPCTKEQAEEYVSSQRRNIQDIFPELDANQRDLLISQACNCWES